MISIFLTQILTCLCPNYYVQRLWPSPVVDEGHSRNLDPLVRNRTTWRGGTESPGTRRGRDWSRKDTPTLRRSGSSIPGRRVPDTEGYKTPKTLGLKTWVCRPGWKSRSYPDKESKQKCPTRDHGITTVTLFPSRFLLPLIYLVSTRRHKWGHTLYGHRDLSRPTPLPWR